MKPKPTEKEIDILIETIQRHNYPVYCNPEYCGIKEKHTK